jgi:hypothetical protein
MYKLFKSWNNLPSVVVCGYRKMFILTFATWSGIYDCVCAKMWNVGCTGMAVSLYLRSNQLESIITIECTHASIIASTACWICVAIWWYPQAPTWFDYNEKVERRRFLRYHEGADIARGLPQEATWHWKAVKIMSVLYPLTCTCVTTSWGSFISFITFTILNRFTS